MIAAAAMLGAMLRVQRGGGASAAALCATLLRHAGAPGQVIAVTQPGSRLDRALVASVPAERLFRHAAPPDRVGETFQPALGGGDGATASAGILLGERDRDIPAAVARPWPGPAAAGPRRMRRVDTLYGDSHRLGLLVIEAAADAPSVLRGAARVLGRHAPALVVDLAGVEAPARPALWEAFAAATDAAGHVWFDSLLMPCISAQQRADAATLCAERVVCALPPGHRLMPDLPRTDSAAAVAAHDPPAAVAAHDPPAAVAAHDATAAFATLAQRGWTSPVLAEDIGAAGSWVPFDDALPCLGFHAAETDGQGAWWRWSGPDPLGTFALPVPGAGRFVLRLDVLVWGVADGPGALRLSTNGVPLRWLGGDASGARFGDIVLDAQAPGLLRIDILTPNPRRASDQDPRRIGVNLRGAALERVG